MSEKGKERKFHEYLEFAIDFSGKKQKEIATALGYTKPNIITMFKQGLTKVPIDKIPKLADILEVDRAKLMRMAMAEYMPETLAAIEKCLGYVVTDNERAIIDGVRKLSNNSDPYPQPKALEEFVVAISK